MVGVTVVLGCGSVWVSRLPEEPTPTPDEAEFETTGAKLCDDDALPVEC